MSQGGNILPPAGGGGEGGIEILVGDTGNATGTTVGISGGTTGLTTDASGSNMHITGILLGESGGTGLNNAGMTINLKDGLAGWTLQNDGSGNATWQPSTSSGIVNSVIAGTNISVDSTDPENPVVSVIDSPTFTGTVGTTNNILDDGSGNANFAGAVIVNSDFVDSFPSFQVYNGSGTPNFYVSPSTNLVGTINNILDDGSGNFTSFGNVTVGSPTGAGQSLIIPTNTYDTYNPTLTSSNSGGFSNLSISSDSITYNLDDTEQGMFKILGSNSHQAFQVASQNGGSFNIDANSFNALYYDLDFVVQGSEDAGYPIYFYVYDATGTPGTVITLNNTLDDASGNLFTSGSITSNFPNAWGITLGNDGFNNSAIYMGTETLGQGIQTIRIYSVESFDGVVSPTGLWDITQFQSQGTSSTGNYKGYRFSDYNGSSYWNILPNTYGASGFQAATLTLDLPGTGLLYIWDFLEVADALVADGYLGTGTGNPFSTPPLYPIDMAPQVDSNSNLTTGIRLQPSSGIPPIPSIGAVIYSVVNGDTGFSVPYYQDEGGNNYPWGTGGGSGSVTEVATTDYLTVDGTPGASITTSGTLSINPEYFDFDPGTTFNLFIGTNAASLPSGFYNTVGGFGAGGSLASGAQSTLFGYMAGAAQVSNNYTTAFGNNTLAQTTGISNNGFGSLAGYNLVGGNYNSCFGESSLGASVSDSYNAAFGYHAMWIGVGGNNSIFGAQASVAITSLSDCTFVGYNTGTLMTNCTGLSLFGSGATAVDGISSSGAFGFGAIVGQSNSHSYGNASGISHGFGTAVPQATVHILGNQIIDASGINSYTNAGFYQAGQLTGQFIEQSSGSTPELLLQITVPNSGDANLGSALTVEVELIGVDIFIGSNGSAYAKTSAQVVFDSTAVTFISGSAPTITFVTSGGYFTTTAAWSIVGNTLALTVTGPTGLSANWIGTYTTFATATGLSP